MYYTHRYTDSNVCCVLHFFALLFRFCFFFFLVYVFCCGWVSGEICCIGLGCETSLYSALYVRGVGWPYHLGSDAAGECKEDAFELRVNAIIDARLCGWDDTQNSVDPSISVFGVVLLYMAICLWWNDWMTGFLNPFLKFLNANRFLRITWYRENSASVFFLDIYIYGASICCPYLPHLWFPQLILWIVSHQVSVWLG